MPSRAHVPAGVKKGTLRGRPQGAPILLVVVALGLALMGAGCARESDVRRPPQAHPAYRHYPWVSTVTGGINLFLTRFFLSGSRVVSAREVRPEAPLRFRLVTRGRAGNWSWKVMATPSLIADYRRYAQGKWALRWSLLFTLLRTQERQAFARPLPALQVTIRMVPWYLRYSWTCYRWGVDLCYALPFRHTLGRRGLPWIEAMEHAALYLSHEITLALLVTRNDPYAPSFYGVLPTAEHRTVMEAQAYLLNLYFLALFVNRAAPLQHGALSTSGLIYGQGLDIPREDVRLFVGEQMANIALQRSLGRDRLICPGDWAAWKAYRAVVYRSIRDPRWLRKLEKVARRTIVEPYQGGSPVLTLITPRGPKVAPLRNFASIGIGRTPEIWRGQALPGPEGKNYVVMPSLVVYQGKRFATGAGKSWDLLMNNLCRLPRAVPNR